MTRTNKITITKQQETPLSKEQKQFNKLNSQIAKEKEQLLNWQNRISEFKIVFANELTPLQSQHDKLRAQLVYLLDEIYDNKLFTKNERKKMLYIIEEIAQALAGSDEKVKTIYNKRGNNDFDEEQATMNEMAIDHMKSMVSEQFDINLDHIEINDPEDFMREFAKQMQEKLEADEAKKATRKKSAKTIEKEAATSKKEQEISQSIKEVYRQLAKTLHPDREVDPVERERKTELMQKVNTAYNKNDLLALLQMQLEIEQIDQSSINSISVEKVKHYNAVLKRQLQEVKQEIYFICETFNMEFEIDVPMFTAITSPEWIIVQLKKDMQAIKKDIKQLKNDLETWKDNAKLKEYLKEIKVPTRTSQNIPRLA